MNLQAKKLEIVQLILNIEKPALLKKVEDILKKEKVSDWWDEISDEERAEIEQGLAEADRGEVIPHEVVMEKYKKWMWKSSGLNEQTKVLPELSTIWMKNGLKKS